MKQLEIIREKKPAGYVTYEKDISGKYRFVSNDRYFDIVWGDRRFLDCYPNVEAHIGVGDCMEPDIKSGDMVLISKTTPALPGDAVLIEHPDKGRRCQRYHENKNRRWVTSADGEMTLDAKWSVFGVVLLIARPVEEVIIPYNGELVSVPILGVLNARE